MKIFEQKIVERFLINKKILGLILSLALVPVFSINSAASADSPTTYDYTSSDVDFRLSLLQMTPAVSCVNSGTASIGGRLLFSADDGIHGCEIWISDGTQPGTFLLKDIYPGAASGDPYDWGVFGNKVIFGANDGVHGRETWISDGTTSGTVMLYDLFDESSGIQRRENAYEYVPINSTQALFTAWEPNTGAELWITDGTTAGTHLLKDINPGSGSSYPGGYFVLPNGTVVFGANDDPNFLPNFGGPYVVGTLWKTDGTAAGTTKVSGGAYLAPARVDLQGPIDYFVSLNGSAYFWGESNYKNADGTLLSEDWQLWKTDGISASQVKLIHPNNVPGVTSGGLCGDFTFITKNNVINGNMYFSADDGVHGCEPWISDGTEAGTRMIIDGFTGAVGSQPYSYATMNNKVYFAAKASGLFHPIFNPNGDFYTPVLWTSDGTESNTKPVPFYNPPGPVYVDGQQISAQSSSNFIQRIFSIGRIASEYGTAIYVTDGSAAGTQKLAALWALSGFQTAGNKFYIWLDDTGINLTNPLGVRLYVLEEIPKNTTSPSIIDPNALAPLALSTSTISAAPTGSGTGGSRKASNSVTYTGNPGTWTSQSSQTINFAYQWYQCTAQVSNTSTDLPVSCAPVNGATTQNYTYTPTNSGSTNLSLAVTATIPGALSRTVWSPSVKTPSAPGAVGNLAVSVSKLKTIVSWSPANSNSAAILRYEYQYGVLGSSKLTNWTSVKLDLIATLSGLKTGSSYIVNVRAVNSIGNGLISSLTFTQL